MLIRRILIFCLCPLWFIFAAESVQFEAEETPFEQILAKAKNQNKLVLLDLYADWSTWCKKLDQEVYTDPEVIKFSEKFICIKKNREQAEGVALSEKYQPGGYPCVLFVDAEGHEIDRIAGFVEASRFLKVMVNIYLGIDTFTGLIKAHQNEPGNVSTTFKLAEKYSVRGQVKPAKVLYEKVLELDRDNSSGYLPNTHFALGNMAVKANELASAEHHFKTILSQYPDFDAVSYVYRSLGWIYTTQNKSQHAIEVLEQGLNQLSPEVNKDALFYFLSLNYSLIGHDQMALDVLKEINSNEVDPFLLQKVKARSHFRLGDLQQGLAILAEEYEKIKNDPQKVNDLAWLCVEEKVKAEQPIRWAESAANLSQRDPLILDTLAELYALNNRLPEAIKIEEEALQSVKSEKYQQQFSQKIKNWKAQMK